MAYDIKSKFTKQIRFLVGETEKLLQSDVIESVNNACTYIINGIMEGNRIFICGNGGSAADAQHFAAELVGRFKSNDRPPLPCIALTVDTSILTAIANDFGYDNVFARQLKALASSRDILINKSASR